MKHWMKERWTVSIHLLGRESHSAKGSFWITCACVPSESSRVAPSFHRSHTRLHRILPPGFHLNRPSLAANSSFCSISRRSLYTKLCMHISNWAACSPTSHHRSVQYKILPPRWLLSRFLGAKGFWVCLRYLTQFCRGRCSSEQ